MQLAWQRAKSMHGCKAEFYANRSYEVTFPAYVNGMRLLLTASVVPGNTPFLISRAMESQTGLRQCKSWVVNGSSQNVAIVDTTS